MSAASRRNRNRSDVGLPALPVPSPGTADQWGRIVALADSDGRPIGVMDAFIAAIAAHRLTLVTRNTKDFETTGVRLFNPMV